ncbi:MAG TPA: helix-turn-helix transcriptional regulator [Planctomycetota bacterium]|nr:helix-turn-helix transcriptional regulator [Planctomycetota bacterium]
MNTAKRKKLEAAGWEVGTPAKFLGLSAEEDQLIEIKLALATALRKERSRRGWTQTHLAQRLGSSQSRLAKMEAGDRSVSIDLLVGALVRLGATRDDLAKFLKVRAA